MVKPKIEASSDPNGSRKPRSATVFLQQNGTREPGSRMRSWIRAQDDTHRRQRRNWSKNRNLSFLHIHHFSPWRLVMSQHLCVSLVPHQSDKLSADGKDLKLTQHLISFCSTSSAVYSLSRPEKKCKCDEIFITWPICSASHLENKQTTLLQNNSAYFI